jgi:HAE1 family hydrophobic/amphiphilic exporter-1
MGTAVFWGMLIATMVGVFLIPGLFAMVERIGLGKKKEAKVGPTPTPAAAASAGAH